MESSWKSVIVVNFEELVSQRIFICMIIISGLYHPCLLKVISNRANESGDFMKAQEILRIRRLQVEIF